MERRSYRHHGARLASLWLVGLSLLGTDCRNSGPPETVSQARVDAATPPSTFGASPDAPPPGIPLDAQHTVGPPIVLGNLAVFPIYARSMEDLGDFVTLDAALEKGTAVVHEMGEGTSTDAGESQAFLPGQRRDGARVNQLVIVNKGELPILVLAGTVVKGGKQDRQIGQDFIVGKGQEVPVDAFCVEHGRWNAMRDGVATHGRFKTLKVLAAGDVRAAGQYEKNQGEVWAKVGAINRATGKQTSSDTLTASLEDPAADAERAQLSQKIEAFLGSVPMADRTVGLAYAVGGEVAGARYFIHHKLFVMYEGILVGTAIVESSTEKALAKAQGRPDRSGECAAEAVAKFVSGVGGGRQEEKSTAGANVNQYQFADDAYAAEVKLKVAPHGKSSPTPVTKDFLRKKKASAP